VEAINCATPEGGGRISCVVVFATFAEAKTFAAKAAVRCLKAANAEEAEV
jgi:hypothetical protein